MTACSLPAPAALATLRHRCLAPRVPKMTFGYLRGGAPARKSGMVRAAKADFDFRRSCFQRVQQLPFVAPQLGDNQSCRYGAVPLCLRKKESVVRQSLNHPWGPLNGAVEDVAEGGVAE